MPVVVDYPVVVKTEVSRYCLKWEDGESGGIITGVRVTFSRGNKDGGNSMLAVVP